MNGQWKKELAKLQRDKVKAQNQKDLKQESEICNRIGLLYVENGEHEKAYKEHLTELSLSEAVNDSLGAAIAHRKIGECLSEYLSEYELALEHQMKHLQMSRQLNDFTEEQRALATIGRTYFIWADASDKKGKTGRLQRAIEAYLSSLDVCDKIESLKEQQVMSMKGRLFLNIGLVYEEMDALDQALQFMNKAFIIAREQKDLQTVYRCHVSIGSLYSNKGRPASALRSYEEAKRIAKKLQKPLMEADALTSMGMMYLYIGDFIAAKQSYKTAYKLSFHQDDERKAIGKSLVKVRRMAELMERVDILSTSEKMQCYEEIGDLCSKLNLHKMAIEHYQKQLALTKSESLNKKTVSGILVSIAMSYQDLGQHSKALEFYERDLALWKDADTVSPEAYSSYLGIARNKMAVGFDFESVMQAYRSALVKAQVLQCSSGEIAAVYKHIATYCTSMDHMEEASEANEEYEQIINNEPEAAFSSESEPESSENTQDGYVQLTPSEGSSEDDEETLVPINLSAGKPVVARRIKRSRLLKRNEKGETLLHVAAIQGEVKMAEQLIREGILVNERDNFGWTPLHEACNWGHVDVVRLLLNNGAYINDIGRQGRTALTPLHDACWNMHVDVVRVLLERGADPTIKNGHGQTPLAQVTEMLQLTKETLSSSGHHVHRRMDLAKGSRNAGSLEEIASLLVEKMPRREVEVELNEGAAALTVTEEIHSSVKRKIMTRDRSGKDLLNDDNHDDEDIDNINGEMRADQSMGFPLTSTQISPPLGLIVMSSDDEENEPKGLTNDSWLVNDTSGGVSRKRHRDNTSSLMHNPQSSEKRLKRHNSATSSAPSRHRTQRRRAVQQTLSTSLTGSRSASRSSSNSDFNVVDLDGREDFQIGTQPEFGTTTEFASSGRPSSSNSSSKAPESRHKVRVTIEGKTFLILCPSGGSSTVPLSWLAKESAKRYLNHHGRRPHLSLQTRDGAQLCLDDMITDVLEQNEEVIGFPESWELPQIVEMYETKCRQTGRAPCTRLSKLLKNSSVTIKLTDKGLRKEVLSPLLQCLHMHHSLCELDLSGNFFGDDNLTQISDLLTSLPHFTQLDLSNTGMSTKGLNLMLTRPPASSLVSNLEVLKLGYNNFCNGERGIAKIVNQFTCLKKLHLEHCDLDLSSVFTSGEVLQHMPNMVDLKLSGNRISNPGTIQTLLNAVVSLSSVHLLDVSSTSSAHSPSFNQDCQEVKPSLSLTSLSLHACGLTVPNLDKLQSVFFTRMLHLQEMSLSGNYLTAAAVDTIVRIIQEVSSLAKLSLAGNKHIGNDCLKIIGAAVTSCHIRELDVCDCGIVSPVQRELQTLERELRLHKEPFLLCDLSGNQLKDSEEKRLLQLISSNRGATLF